MNGLATTNSANGSNGMGKAQLEINVPFHAKLKFDKGLPVESSYGGTQMLYTLADDHKLYLPLHVAEKMEQIGGREFILCKKQSLGSRRIVWTVNRADIFPPDVRQAVGTPRPPATALTSPPPAPPPRPTQVEAAYDDGDYNSWGDPPPTKEEERAANAALVGSTSPQAAPAAANAQQSPSRMTAALIAAIDSLNAATTYGRETWGIALEFSEEDVRCVAATIYIQNARNAA